MGDCGEQELLERIRQGDGAALQFLIDDKLPRIFALARRVLNDRADAEDVAQETLVRVWRRPPALRPGGGQTLDPWMHRVALNLCLDRLRRRRETPAAVLPELIDESPTPERRVLAMSVAERIGAALDTLCVRQRLAIVLCHVQQLSNIEAADSMGISVDALESVLARARRTMRADLADLVD